MLLLCAVTARTQESFNLALGGGPNLNTYKFKEAESHLMVSPTLSFHFVAQVSFPIAKKLNLQSGLTLIQKGGYFEKKPESPSNYYAYTSTSSPVYLSIPLRLLYFFNPKSENRFYAGLGAYAAIGIGGIHKLDYADGSGNPINYDGPLAYVKPYYGYPTASGGGNIQRQDFGAGLTAGWIHHHLQLALSYEAGLYNISWHNVGSPGVMYNRSLQLTVAYRIKK